MQKPEEEGGHGHSHEGHGHSHDTDAGYHHDEKDEETALPTPKIEPLRVGANKLEKK